ncbi:MAG: trigger factor [Gammaproteobacteria bacterium]
MQVSVEQSGSLGRRVTVTIPGDQIEQEVARRLDDVAKRSKIKGFRPGKAPAKVVRQQYGEAVREDVLADLVRSHYAQALQGENISPVSAPTVEPGETATDGSYTFTAELEVYPEFEVKDIADASLVRPQVEISEADVDAILDRLRSQHQHWNAVERAATEGDQVVIDFEGRIEGEPFDGNSATDMPLVLGSGSVIPGFEQGLIGAEAGATRTLDLAFPEDYSKAELAGKPVSFEVTVKRVEESHLPELNEDFAAHMGIEEGGLTRLREKVRENMQNELDARIRSEMEKQASDALLAANAIDVPKALVDDEIVRQQRATMRQFGLQVDSDSVPDLPREPFVEKAERRVRLGLALSQLIEREQFQPDPARVERKIEEFAADAEDSAAQARAMRADNGMMRQVESLVLEEIAYDWLIEQAQVSEEPKGFFEFIEPEKDGAGDNA